MSLLYKEFKNTVTGQVISIPAGRYGNFLSAIKKISNYVRYNIPRYYVVHLTLTVAENTSEIDFKHLHRVISFIRLRLQRAGSDFKYVAVKELQDRGAIHYHVLCFYSKARVFPENKDIAKSWRLGFVKITAPKGRLRLDKIANYLGKYIGKGYEYSALEAKKSFTASQIIPIYKMSSKRLDFLMDRYGKDHAELFKCTYRTAFLEWIEDKVETIMGQEIRTRKRSRIVMYGVPPLL